MAETEDSFRFCAIHPASPEDVGAVTGLWLAGRELLEAVTRYSRASECRFYAPVLALDDLRSRFDARTEAVRAGRLLIADSAELFHEKAHASGSLWHEAFQGDVIFQIRARLPARLAFPITRTLHELIPFGTIQSRYLPIALGDFRPYDALIAPSRATKRAAELLIGEVVDHLNGALGTRIAWQARIEVIPNGIDTEVFAPSPVNKARYRRDHGLPAEAIVILFVGRVNQWSKADLVPLLRVFAELVEESERELCLCVAGGTGTHPEGVQYGEDLRAYVDDLGVTANVRFLGHVEPDSRHVVYAAADIFVSVNDNVVETFSLTVLEAMASGLPQVVSDWSGIRDIVRQDETGLLLPTYVTDWAAGLSTLQAGFSDFAYRAFTAATAVDVGALKRALQALVADSSLRERMAARSRERAVTHFSYRNVVRLHDELWSELRGVFGRQAPPDRPAALPMFPDLCRVFRSYATRELPDEAKLSVTVYGADLAEGRLELPVFWEDVLDRAIVERLLSKLMLAGAAGVTMGALVDAATSPPVVADHERRHMMWLLKYGIAQLIS